MLKKALILLIIALLVYFTFTFLKSEEESFAEYFRERMLVLTEGPKEKSKEFLDERREAIEDEIEREKEKAGERLEEAGKNLWQNLGDYIFNLVSSRDNNEE